MGSSKKKTVTLKTLERVKKYIKNRKGVTKTAISKALNINYNSVKIALDELGVK